MKTLLMSLILAGAALAAPLTCFPNLPLDGISIDTGCPQVGASFSNIPGTTWEITFEDLPLVLFVSDRDYNDSAVLVKFTGAEATFTYLGANSTLEDSLLINGVPLFDSFTSIPGTAVTLNLSSLDISFKTLYFGTIPAVYPVGSEQVWVSCLDGKCPSAVPEPGTWSLWLCGLGGVWAGRRRLIRRG